MVPDSAVDDLSLANIGVVGDIAVNSGPLVVGRPLSLLMDSKGITGISERNPAELVCLISCLLPYLHSRLALILVARHRINTECAQVLLVSINLNEEGAVLSCSRVDKDHAILPSHSFLYILSFHNHFCYPWRSGPVVIFQEVTEV